MNNYLTRFQLKLLKTMKPHDRAEYYIQDHYALGEMLGTDNYTQVASALIELKDDGYVEYQHLDNGLFKIFLTHKGCAYQEIRNAALKERWGERLWSFLIGVCTGLSIAYFAGLLGV